MMAHHCHAHGVMPALVAGIHVFLPIDLKAWMAGTSPAMTKSATRHCP